MIKNYSTKQPSCKISIQFSKMTTRLNDISQKRFNDK